jgi:hypothetical protein
MKKKDTAKRRRIASTHTLFRFEPMRLTHTWQALPVDNSQIATESGNVKLLPLVVQLKLCQLSGS